MTRKLSRFKVENEDSKDFKFTLFGKSQNSEKDKRYLSLGLSSRAFNVITEDGAIKSGYGIKELSMPESEEDLETESTIAIRGSEVRTMWKLKWYNGNTEKDCYYLFYFNDETIICFDNMFERRPATFIIQNDFTDTPYVTYYRKDGQDAFLLSGEGGNLTVLTGGETYTSETAPRIINCCRHYGKLFAITDDNRGKLVYNENPDILTWNDTKTKDLDFSDERGDLNKIISFNDYLYIFRDFGITEISEYGTDELFAISHLYQSTASIVPNSIAQGGGKIFFLEGNKIKEFNGNSVKDVEIDCFDLLKGSQRYAYGVCFDGKYYLACRGNFNDGKTVGCECCANGYKNNMLLIYSIDSGHVDILRGVDIHELLALTNKFKSKIIANFYNDNIGKIGEITTDGEVFGEDFKGVWKSGVTDFSMPGKVKRIKYFSVQSADNCQITISSENGSKTFNIKGEEGVQKVNVNLLGKQFEVKIETDNQGKVNISELTFTVSERQ